MANIKLTGNLDLDLLRIGYKEGDIVTAYPDLQSKVGAMYFTKGPYDCVVWPENYEIVNKKESLPANKELCIICHSDTFCLFCCKECDRECHFRKDCLHNESDLIKRNKYHLYNKLLIPKE
jgi:hypothetical protein